MTLALPLKRRPEPEDARHSLLFFSLLAAAGFAFGWFAQALGSF